MPTHPGPHATYGQRHTFRMLHDRDPMLALAVVAHGAEWRTDLQPELRLERNDAQGLPSVIVSTLDHRIEWKQGTGQVVHLQTWSARQSRWIAGLTIGALPETIATTLEGRNLADVLDAPGADAWMIEHVRLVPDVLAELTLERRPLP